MTELNDCSDEKQEGARLFEESFSFFHYLTG